MPLPSRALDATGLPSRPRVLVLVGYYLPGQRGGGPTRSIVNLVEALGDEFDFRIVAFDHDLGVDSRFADVEPGRWVAVGKAHVWYLASGFSGVLGMIEVLRRTPADVVYLNSFFAPLFSILPVAMATLTRYGSPPLIVAPRGELSEGALQFKAFKKGAFLELIRMVGLYRRDRIVFQSSNAAEAEDIRRELTRHVKTLIAKPLSHSSAAKPRPIPRIVTAQDLASAEPVSTDSPKSKRKGSLRVAWISRIVRKKNLDGALRCVRSLLGDIHLTIHGPDEDRDYWAECRQLIEALPANVRATYGGILKHEDVVPALEAQDVLLFPTHGENYGHVILEALTAGCPVIISDQTPWRGLASLGVGWDLPLDEPGAMVAALQRCVEMDGPTFEAFSKRVRSYAASIREDQVPIEQHRQLFRSALALRRQRGAGGTEAA
jgi:glycosyltransferase involved in cell wall biosynthesis